MNSANHTQITPGATSSPRHNEVEILAFTLWQERGAPIGTPETDWFRAEEELRPGSDDADPALSVIAKTIGSALGSVAALVSPKTPAVSRSDRAEPS